jgi:hypothetical protein
LIFRYVEDYGFITIGQCYEIWYSDKKYGYDMARRELNKIIKEGYLRSYKDSCNVYTEKIFYIEEKFKRPTRSMMLAMNVYAEMCRLGTEVLYFNREEPWLKSDENNRGKYRSDGFIIFKLDKYVYSAFIEVIDHNTASYNHQKKLLTTKYTDIYDSGEPIEKIKEVTKVDKDFPFPILLIIDEINHNSVLEIENTNIIFTNFKLEKLSQLFI